MGSVDFQRDGSWLDPLSLDPKLQSEIIVLAGRDGYCITISKHFLLAKSELVKSILRDMCNCQVTSNKVCLSVPFASSSSLKHTVEILTTGETSVIKGLNQTIAKINEVKVILQTLGVEINIGPKLITSLTKKFTCESIQNKDMRSRENSVYEQTNLNYIARQLAFDQYKDIDITAQSNDRLISKHNKELGILEESQCFVSKLSLDSNTSSLQHRSHAHSENQVRTKSDCFTCEFCRNTYASRRILDSHLKMKSCLVPLLKCPLCRLRMRSKVKMNEHISKVHGNKEDINSDHGGQVISEKNTYTDCFKCKFCMNIFSSKKTLNEHLKMKTCLEPLVKCPKCRLRYRSKDTLNEHISRIHGSYEGNNNNQIMELDGNVNSVHTVRGESCTSYTKEKRGSLTIKAEQFEVPIIRDMHENNNPEESLVTKLGDEDYSMDSPSRVTSDRVNSMISKFNGMWHCKICWMGFPLENKSSLKDHLLAQHESNKAISCEKL